MFGFDPGELVGQLIEVLVPESFRAVHQKQRQGYVADPKTRKLGSGPELIGRRQDGTEFPLDIGLAHIGSGDDLLVIAAVRDMTARHESEESRRHADRMSAVVEFSGDAIIAGTLDGVITNWNPAAERLFGYTSQEVAGRTASLLSAKGRIHDAGAVTAKIRAGEPVEHLETLGKAPSLRRSPLPHRDQPMLGRPTTPRSHPWWQRPSGRSIWPGPDRCRTLDTACSEACGRTRNPCGSPCQPSNCPLGHAIRVRSACDPRAIRVRSEGTSVANPVH